MNKVVHLSIFLFSVCLQCLCEVIGQLKRWPYCPAEKTHIAPLWGHLPISYPTLSVAHTHKHICTIQIYRTSGQWPKPKGYPTKRIISTCLLPLFAPSLPSPNRCLLQVIDAHTLPPLPPTVCVWTLRLPQAAKKEELRNSSCTVFSFSLG